MIRDLRLAKALTQEALAVKARMSRKTIQRIEGGCRLFPSSLRLLAEALGVKPEKLVVKRLLSRGARMLRNDSGNSAHK